MYLTDNHNNEIGYWRKHPNLHGYIVQNFADGVDECQSIPLSIDDVRNIIIAVEDNDLPDTTGFFFGVSQPEDMVPTLKIFREALDKMENDSTYRVTYQASW